MFIYFLVLVWGGGGGGGGGIRLTVCQWISSKLSFLCISCLDICLRKLSLRWSLCLPSHYLKMEGSSRCFGVKLG